METSGVKGFLKELGIELVSEFFSIGMMKKILAKEAAARTVAGKDGMAGPEVTKIKNGGLFNLTDETAYLALMAQLEQDPASKDVASKVSAFLNGPSFTDGQRRRFRVVVGHLAETEYVREVNKTKETIPRFKGTPSVKESSKEVRTNLGIEFLKSFSRLTDPEKLAICEASGIMDTFFDHLGQGIASIGDAITSFEKHPTTQNVMATLAEKMRARITTLNNRRTIGGTT